MLNFRNVNVALSHLRVKGQLSKRDVTPICIGRPRPDASLHTKRVTQMTLTIKPHLTCYWSKQPATSGPWRLDPLTLVSPKTYIMVN